MQMEGKKNIEIAELIKKVSPIAWHHVNLGGRFEFTRQKTQPNIEEMISKIESFLEKLAC